MFPLFFLTSSYQATFFTLSEAYILQDDTSLVTGHSPDLRWVGWREIEPAVSSMGQPQLLFTEVTLQPPWPVPGHHNLILTYTILEIHMLYTYIYVYKRRQKLFLYS